jgi:hypothetical protein
MLSIRICGRHGCGPRRNRNCYGHRAGEDGGVIKSRLHLSQAAKLSRKMGPPLFGREAIGLLVESHFRTYFFEYNVV